MNIDNYAVESWLPFTLDPLEENQPLDEYLVQLQKQWQEKLGDMSPLITQYFANEEMRYAFRMRYQGNVPRAWFAKKEDEASGIRPLLERPVPKDRWVSHDAEAFSYPPMPGEFVEHSIAL
jgi:hypothetical protein